MEKVKIDNLEQLINLKNEGNVITYDTGIHNGIVRRIEKKGKYYLVAVRMSDDGTANLSEFKFYTVKPKEINLSSFFYTKEVKNNG